MLIIDAEQISFVSLNKKTIKDRHGNIRNNPAYNKFKESVAWLCKRVKIDPPYKVLIIVETNLDLTNFEKPIMDGIQMAGIIDNDKNVKDCQSLIFSKRKGLMDRLTVHVKNIDWSPPWDRAHYVRWIVDNF